jgi:hypothetical protein
MPKAKRVGAVDDTDIDQSVYGFTDDAEIEATQFGELFFIEFHSDDRSKLRNPLAGGSQRFCEVLGHECECFIALWIAQR